MTPAPSYDEAAARVHDALAPLAGAVAHPVEHHEIRRVGARIVLEHSVHGAPLAFEVQPCSHGTSCKPAWEPEWELAVVVHHDVDEPQVARLGLEPVAPRRWRVATLDGGTDSGTDGGTEGSAARVADRVAGACREVLDRLAELGPPEATRELLDALGLREPLVVVDVGANPLERPAYARLVGLGAARVVGFEPQPEAFAALQSRDQAREQYFPHAIGAPGPAELRLYEASGFASLFDVDERTIDLVGDDGWRRGTRLRDVVPLRLTGLDEVPGLPKFDLLKIDVQGGELAVFESGRRALASALCVVPEVGFLPLYRDAPSFAEVHRELLDQGFGLHKFLFQKSVHLHGSQSGVEQVAGVRSQLVDGDAVYLRDLRGLRSFADDDLRRLVLLATFVFDSPDLAVLALDELVGRGAVAADVPAAHAATRFV